MLDLANYGEIDILTDWADSNLSICPIDLTILHTETSNYKVNQYSYSGNRSRNWYSCTGFSSSDFGQSESGIHGFVISQTRTSHSNHN